MDFIPIKYWMDLPTGHNLYFTVYGHNPIYCMFDVFQPEDGSIVTSSFLMTAIFVHSVLLDFSVWILD